MFSLLPPEIKKNTAGSRGRSDHRLNLICQIQRVQDLVPTRRVQLKHAPLSTAAQRVSPSLSMALYSFCACRRCDEASAATGVGRGFRV